MAETKYGDKAETKQPAVHPFNTPLPIEEPHEWTPEQLATPPACEPWPLEMNPTQTAETKRGRRAE